MTETDEAIPTSDNAAIRRSHKAPRSADTAVPVPPKVLLALREALSDPAMMPRSSLSDRQEFEHDDDEGLDDVCDDDPDGCEPVRRGAGHMVMDRNAIRAALKATGYTNSFDHLSSGEEQRVRQLLLHQKSQLFRPHLVADDAMMAQLEHLGSAAPNFAAMTELVVRAAHLSRVTGKPLCVPPVLLLGEPGSGKTRYAKALANALTTSAEIIVGTTIPDVKSLTGYGAAWRGAAVGRIGKAILAAPTTAPIIFIDEATRVADREEGPYPLDRLLTLMEPHSAAAFVDEFLLVPMRADRVVWLMAANDCHNLSEPFLDRIVVIDVPPMTAEQRGTVVRAMFAEVLSERGIFIARPDGNILDAVRGVSLRRTRLTFELAIATAVAQGRRHLIPDDLAEAVRLLGQGTAQQRPIGFIQRTSGRSD